MDNPFALSSLVQPMNIMDAATDKTHAAALIIKDFQLSHGIVVSIDGIGRETDVTASTLRYTCNR